MSNCDFVAGRSLIALVRVKAGATRPRATRGFGLDPTKSISAAATKQSARSADREGGRPKRRHHEPWH